LTALSAGVQTNKQTNTYQQKLHLVSGFSSPPRQCDNAFQQEVGKREKDCF